VKRGQPVSRADYAAWVAKLQAHAWAGYGFCSNHVAIANDVTPGVDGRAGKRAQLTV